MAFWLKNGKFLVNGSGKLYDCEDCPCEEEITCCLEETMWVTLDRYLSTGGGPPWTYQDSLVLECVYDATKWVYDPATPEWFEGAWVGTGKFCEDGPELALAFHCHSGGSIQMNFYVDNPTYTISTADLDTGDQMWYFPAVGILDCDPFEAVVWNDDPDPEFLPGIFPVDFCDGDYPESSDFVITFSATEPP